MLSLLIADDHPIVLDGVKRLLETVPGWTVRAVAMTTEEAMDHLERGRVDVAVVDLSLPEVGGLELIRMAKTRWDPLRIVVLSMHGESPYIIRAFRAGASGYVLKSDSGTDLIDAVRAVMRGERFLGPSLDPTLRFTPSDDPADPLETLSDREREVLALVGTGRSSAAIAERLQVSVRTVDTHRAHIMAKLGIHRTAELVHYALSRRVTPPLPPDPT